MESIPFDIQHIVYFYEWNDYISECHSQLVSQSISKKIQMCKQINAIWHGSDRDVKHIVLECRKITQTNGFYQLEYSDYFNDFGMSFIIMGDVDPQYPKEKQLEIWYDSYLTNIYEIAKTEVMMDLPKPPMELWSEMSRY